MAKAKHPMLTNNVDVKQYGGINIPMSEEEKNMSIPEPSFTPPPFTMDDDEEVGESEELKKEKKERQPFNEDLEDLSAKDRKAQAEGLADVIIGVYEYAHQFPEGFVKINKEKAKQAQVKGEINLNAKVRFQDGTEKTIESVIDEYNNDLSGVFVVSQEFKDNVKPLLTRILQKKGVGLTDEEMLAYFVVMDLVQKGTMFYQLIRQKKATFEELKIISKNLGANGYTAPPQPTAQQPNSEDAAPSPLADNEVENVKKDGTKETVIVEEEEPIRKRGRKPKTDK